MPWEDEEYYGGGYDMGEEQVDVGWGDYGGDYGGGSITPSYGGGDSYSPAPSYGSNYGGVSRAMADADYEAASEKEWAKRGSAGAPNRGASSYIVGGPTMYGGGASTLNTRPVAPTIAPPTYEPLKLPEFDEATVKRERQKAAAPYLRNLRSNVQKVMQGRYENPNVKRMTLRDALGGYGQALESVMARAETEGRAAAKDKWSREAQETQMNWQAKINQQNMLYTSQVNQANTQYNQLMKEWMAQNYGQRG
jgi:hypothetical protein